MKKLLKISVLVGILMFALTMICYADEPTDTTTDESTLSKTGDDTATEGGTLPKTDDDTATEGDTLPKTDDDTETTPTTSGSYKATFKSEDDSYINVPLVVEGLPTGKTYKYFVDTNATASYNTNSSELEATESGTYKSVCDEKDLIQLNSDLYIHVFNTDTENTKVADIKIEKPTFNNLNYFTSSSHSSKNLSQFIFAIPYRLNNTDMTRTIHFKIGRVTDSEILRAIKNSESEGFAKLKTYAKNDGSPLYDKNQTATMFNGYATDGEIIPGTSLADGAYYYLYAELDDENGKYIPLESVTLAKADVYPTQDYSWFLFFYGSDKFNLDDLEDPDSTDDSTDPESPPVLPDTGEKALAIALIGLTAVVSVVLFKKNKGLKIK